LRTLAAFFDKSVFLDSSNICVYNINILMYGGDTVALINCPECNKQVSDKASACIGCGCPIEYMNTTTKLKKVILTSYGTKKIECIKYILEFGYLPNLSLSEAKALVESTSAVIADGVDINNANKIVNELAKFGATAVIEDSEKTEELIEDSAKAEESVVNTTSSDTLKPKCPKCQSTDIHKISAIGRIAADVVFGLGSSSIDKTFECRNCEYKW